MRITRTLALFATVAAFACGGGSDDDDNGNPTGPPPSGGASNGSLTANIGGVNWSATGNVSVTRSNPNFIGLGASGFGGSTAYALVIGIANATGPGSHNLNIYTGGGDGSSLIVGTQTAGYGTAFQGGSGTITITSLTANRIVGTFSGTLVPSTGTGANLVITNGQFDITF
jgi:hypothetical protein